jgi:RNA polymerase sigma-70 factor (ECF subfamily)
MRRIGDLCEAEEITQETLLRAYQHRASFATEDELMAWSTVVAQRLVIDRVRVRGRSVAVPDVPETARLGRDTAEVVVARHEARAALESLEAIPTRQAAILWAREVEGLHYEEIAERFGITEPAVRSLLHRGRKALRAEFKNRTGSLPLNGLTPFAPWLLALKAAGKVRGVAKATVKAPATAVAALSITALVAVGIGTVIHGSSGDGRTVAIRPAEGGATQVTALVESPQPVAAAKVRRAVPAHAGERAGTSSYVAPAVPLPPVHVCQGFACFHPAETFKGAVITVGPDLPDNPLGLQNVQVSQDQVSCTSLGLPSAGTVRCTQQGPSEDDGIVPPSDVPDTTRKPSLEGATR